MDVYCMQAGLPFRATLDWTYSAQRFSFFSYFSAFIFILDQLSSIIRQLLPAKSFTKEIAFLTVFLLCLIVIMVYISIRLFFVICLTRYINQSINQSIASLFQT